MEFIAIIIIVSLLLIVAGFMYSAKARKQKLQTRLTAMTEEVARTNNLRWSLVDTGVHRTIAWAADQRMLLFIDFHNEEERTHLVNMHEVSGCQLQKTGNMVLGNNQPVPEKNVTGMALQLFFKDKMKDPVALQFYNEQQDGLFEKTALIEKANYWKELITK